jgi:hypothetical protein
MVERPGCQHGLRGCILAIRPQQFLFLYSGQILLEINVGGRNKTKNKSWPRDCRMEK